MGDRKEPQKEELVEELRRSFFLFHSFDAFLVVDERLRIQACNREVAELFPAAPDISRLEGHALSNLRFPNLIRFLKAHVEKDGPLKVDTSLSLEHDGVNRVIDVKVSSLVDSSSGGRLFLCSLRDITEAFHQEERLWQSNEELTILYEMSQAEVQSVQHDEILKNVLTRFSELTNLGKGFFMRNPAREASGPEFLEYNLTSEEVEVLRRQYLEQHLPRRLFQADAARYRLGSDKLSFFRSMISLGYAEILTIPVFLKNAVFGVLVFLIGEGRSPRISTNHRFLNLLGQQVGLALEKAMLFSELERSFEEIARKNKQFREELALAQKMQRGILSLNFPKKPGIGFAVKYIPSYHLSGDFYDIFELSADKVGVLIADVCGHGINAALITSFLKASVQDMSQNYSRPDQLLEGLNLKLCELLDSRMFVSAFYLIIDTREKLLYYANAGHPYPIYLDRSGGNVEELKSDGTLLSVMDDSKYVTNATPIRSGSRVILYTDGMFDMKNKNGEFISMDYVREITVRNARLGGYDFIDLLIGKMYKFANNRRFDDDINLIVIDFD